MKYIDTTTSAVLDAHVIEAVADLTQTDGFTLLQLPDDGSVPSALHLTPVNELHMRTLGRNYPQPGDFLVQHSDGLTEVIAREVFVHNFRTAE